MRYISEIFVRYLLVQTLEPNYFVQLLLPTCRVCSPHHRIFYQPRQRLRERRLYIVWRGRRPVRKLRITAAEIFRLKAIDEIYE